MIKKNLVILIIILILLTVYNIKENFDSYDSNANKYAEYENEDLVIDEENTIIDDEVKFEKLNKNKEIELLHDKITFLENFIKNYPSIKIKSEDVNLAETINKSILNKYNNNLTSIRSLGSIVKVLMEEDGLLVPGNLTLGEENNNGQISYSGNLEANIIKSKINIAEETNKNNINIINNEISQYTSSFEKYMKFYKMFPTQVLPNLYNPIHSNWEYTQYLPKQLLVYRFKSGNDVWFGIKNSNKLSMLPCEYFMVTYKGLLEEQKKYQNKYGLTKIPNLKAGPWIENSSFKGEFYHNIRDGNSFSMVPYDLVRMSFKTNCQERLVENNPIMVINLDEYLWTQKASINANFDQIPLDNSYLLFKMYGRYYGPLSKSQMMGSGDQAVQYFYVPLWTDDVDNYQLDKNLKGPNGKDFEPVIVNLQGS